jgi:hypothetical protein
VVADGDRDDGGGAPAHEVVEFLRVHVEVVRLDGEAQRV